VQQLTPLTKGIFYTIRHHAQQCEAGGRRMKGEHSELQHLPSQVIVKCDGVLFSWRWLSTCLPMGSSELIPYLTLFACTASALSVKLSAF